MLIAFTPFNPELIRGLRVDCPVILFAEEDFSQSWDSATSHSLLQRTASRFERMIASKSWPKVDEVAVISDREVTWAHRHYPGSQVKVVDGFLDEEIWASITPSSADSCDVLAVGEFGDARNARGLAAFLTELEMDGCERLRIHVVSRNDPHRDLKAVASRTVTWLGSVQNVAPLYRSARLCVVPAVAVSGVKNQVLQGWITGCAVVATSGAAATVGGRDGEDLLAAPTPGDLARAARRLVKDDALRIQLGEQGRVRYHERHHEVRVLDGFAAWVDRLA